MSMARFVAAAVAMLAIIGGGCEEQGSSADGSSSSGGSGGASSAAGSGVNTATTSGGSGGGSTGNAPNGSTFTLRPQSLTAAADMSGIAESVRAFEVNMDRFPTTAEGLAVLVSSDGLERDSDKWQGPYVQTMDVMKDAYGDLLEYENTGSGFILRSLGADGQRGGSGSSADIERRY